jgi:hypothetical protein
MISIATYSCMLFGSSFMRIASGAEGQMDITMSPACLSMQGEYTEIWIFWRQWVSKCTVTALFIKIAKRRLIFSSHQKALPMENIMLVRRDFFTFECCILLRIYLTGSLWRRQSQQSFNTLTTFNFLFHSLHVSAPTGHPQVRYTIVLQITNCIFHLRMVRRGRNM